MGWLKTVQQYYDEGEAGGVLVVLGAGVFALNFDGLLTEKITSSCFLTRTNVSDP